MACSGCAKFRSGVISVIKYVPKLVFRPQENNTMQPMQQQQEKATDNDITNTVRTVRLQLTRPQIKLLVQYAIRNGYKRKSDNVKMDMSEENAIARHGIMLRLGFSDAE